LFGHVSLRDAVPVASLKCCFLIWKEVTKVKDTRDLKLETKKAKRFEVRNQLGISSSKSGIPVRAFTIFSSSVTCSSATAENVGRKVSVGRIIYVGMKNSIKCKDRKNPAYEYVLAKVTFLA
jgi:hypothetical protein